MHDLLHDLRYAARVLARNPGFTAAVVLTLALGIGANTAVFTLLDQVLLRPLPVRAPQELVLLDAPGPYSGSIEGGSETFSMPMYRQIRDENTVFDGTLARFSTAASLSEGGQTERITAELVTGSYLAVLGVGATAGRVLGPEDDRHADGHPVVVLGHGYWTRRFGRDPSLVGRTVVVNGRSMTVAGVAAAGFRGVDVASPADVFVPMAMKAALTPTWDDLDNPRSRWAQVMGRLKPGTARAQAEAAMNVLYARLLVEDLKTIQTDNELFRERFLAKKLDLLPGARGYSELRNDVETPLFVLMGMVGFVLLIACANVANLLMARATGRRRELAIRVTLGAGRGRIVRQLLAESLLLALLGGAAGVLVAAWAGDVLLGTLPYEGLARSISSAPDVRVGLFTLAVSLVTGLLFGLAPAAQLARPWVVSTLKEEAGSVAGGSSAWMRKGLVVAQVSLSLLLLVGSGLFARSLYNLRRLDPGFVADRLLTFSIDPALNAYAPDGRAALFAALKRDLDAIPGVRSASMAAGPILTDSRWARTVMVDGYTRGEDEDMNPQVNAVGPDFFSTLGVPLLAGRAFGEGDVAGAPKVAVVNETFARYFYKEASAIGRRFGFRGDGEAMDIEIVGVVRDGRELTLRDPVLRGVYLPYAQAEDLSRMTFYVRSALPEEAAAAAVREAVRRHDPALPVFDLKTMRTVIDESLFTERLIAVLSAAFGSLATLLAALGLYGVMSYTVARRTREIGIRMALGAQKRSVLTMVMREVGLLAAVGIAVGLPGAWALARVVRAELYGLSPGDPATMASATVLLASVTLLAGFVPARRAARTDPMQALRYE